MTLANLWERALFYLTVPRCVCCNKALTWKEQALCADCLSSYDNMKARDCSLCFHPIHRCTCTNARLNSHFVHRLIKVTRYIKRDEDIPANALVYSVKKDNRKDVEQFMIKEMYASLLHADDHPENAVFTHVPRRTFAVRRFGYDHAARLSKALAKICGGTYVSLFRSRARHAQKELHGNERLSNARVTLRFSHRHTDLHGKRVYLVDDIVTTGASMSAAAMELKAMGAKEIIGVCFSVAYLDA